MAFKRRTGEATVPEDPEQLYRQFALSNNGPEALGHTRPTCCATGTKITSISVTWPLSRRRSQ